MIAIFAYLISFFELYIINSINVAEVITFVLIISSLFYYKKQKIQYDTMLFFALTIWCLISYALINYRSYFVSSSFINNIVRMILYFIGYITLPIYFQRSNKLETFFKHFIYASIVICIIGIIEFITIQLNIDIEYRVSQLFTNEHNFKNYSRISSIFSEPAHLSIYLGTTLSLILMFYKNRIKPKSFNILTGLTLLNLVLAMSLTGTLILVYLVSIMFFNNKHKGSLFTLKRVFWGIITLSFMLFLVTQVDVLNEHIFKRFIEATNSQDASSNARILGSFEYAGFVISEHPITGIGLGQLIPFFQNTNVLLDNYYTNSELGLGGTNNIFVSIIIQTGIVGLIIFLLFIFILFNKDKRSLFFFILLGFSWGFFNSSFFWFYIYMYKTIKIYNKSKNYNNENIPVNIMILPK